MTSMELKRTALRYAKPLTVQGAMRWPKHVAAILAAHPHVWDWYSDAMGEGRTIAMVFNERFRRIALLSLAQNGPRGIVMV